MNLHAPQALFLSGLLLYIAVRSVYRRRAANTKKTVNRSNRRDRTLIVLVILGQIGLPVLYVFSPWLNFANYAPTPAVVCLGAVTWLIGLWVFWRAHAGLGDNWSVTLQLHSAHQLVTHGVYGLVRHPMYASFLLLGIAQALLLPNWLAGAAGLAAVVLMCLGRIPNEEAMMQVYFGQAYEEYVRRTGSVIPRMGRRHAKSRRETSLAWIGDRLDGP
jgi:protein-S-isoprenylcysteine O-methyltransferase Ste14